MHNHLLRSFVVLSVCAVLSACSGGGQGAAANTSTGSGGAASNTTSSTTSEVPVANTSSGSGSTATAPTQSSADTGNTSTVSVTTFSPVGVWEGTWTDSNGNSEPMYALALQDGSIRLMDQSPSAMYVGSYAMQGNDGSGTLTGYAPVIGTYPDGSHTTSVALTMKMPSATSLTGSLSGGGYSGNFTLTPKAGFDRTASLGLVAGQWTYTDPNGSNNVSMSVDASGKLSGTDGQGCTYAGTVSLADTRVNAYNLNVTIGSCGNYDGNYTGVAGLSDGNGGTNNNLLAMISNPGQAFALTLVK